VSEHTDPRVSTVRRFLDAYRAGNLQSMQQWMSVGVRLEAVGNNPLAGTFAGVAGVLAFIARSTQTFVAESVKLEDVLLQGDEVHVIVSGDVMLRDGGTEGVRILQRYRFEKGGKIASIVAEAADDQVELDRLLNEARGT
jgi:ketosteroid isomerase-like protein